MSVLFWPVHFHPKGTTNQIPVEKKYINIDVVFCSLSGSRCRAPRALNGKLLISSHAYTLLSWRHCGPDDLTSTSRWDTWHPHIAAVAKGMMTSCLLLSQRPEEDFDDKGWAQSACDVSVCCVCGWHVGRGAFAASCLSGLLWPVYNWWVEWISDEFVTVSQPDGDGQSSSLALLIWLMMTTLAMMMPALLLRHCPALGLGPCITAVVTASYLFLDGNTKIEGRARKEGGRGKGERGWRRGWCVVVVVGGRRAREWKLDERRAGDGSGGGEAAREWRKSFKRDDDMQIRLGREGGCSVGEQISR